MIRRGARPGSELQRLVMARRICNRDAFSVATIARKVAICSRCLTFAPERQLRNRERSTFKKRGRTWNGRRRSAHQ